MKLKSIAILVVLAVPGLATLQAQVRLPHVLSDHAVLQRDRPIHVWGWSTPESHIVAHFHGQDASATANKYGEWSLYLNPEQAGGPFALTVSGDGPPIMVNDLLVGDVWLASGQSNMEFPLQGFPGAPLKDQEKEIAASNQPRLRLLRLEHKGSDLPAVDQPATWTQCTPATAREFSAVAYFFGREISARENVPIGLIDSSWGGTPADPWLSLYAFGENPLLLPALASRARFAQGQSDLAVIEAAEKAENATAAAAGKPAPSHPWHPEASSWQPSALYNAMIAPLAPLSIKGFLWYQGETNSAHDRAPYYKSLLSGLIADWRERFAQGNLPFYYVQISSFESPGEDWGRVRDQQRRVLDVATTGMAVTLDIGESSNVHPPDKQTVAARLAAAARHMTYGEEIPFSGPLFREATIDCQAGHTCGMRVWFDHADGLSTHHNDLSSFEIAGADHKFVPAKAVIDGETVRVNAEGVPAPVYVRFGWASVVNANLYNAAGFPASTFTSEDLSTP